MQCNAKRIEVEGTKVKRGLEHPGSMDKTAMGHNLVVLKEGTDAMAWSGKGTTAADTAYIPASDDAVVAHTKLPGGRPAPQREATRSASAVLNSW